MFRKFLTSGAGVLALLCVISLPGQLYAQRRGGFRPGMTPQMGRMGMGFTPRMMSPQMGNMTRFDRRFITPGFGSVPSFDRQFINPRLGFTPNFNGTFLSPRLGFGSAFNRGFTGSVNPQLMNLGLERQLLALHLGLF